MVKPVVSYLSSRIQSLLGWAKSHRGVLASSDDVDSDSDFVDQTR
jgi:hypothetical protein